MLIGVYFAMNTNADGGEFIYDMWKENRLKPNTKWVVDDTISNPFPIPTGVYSSTEMKNLIEDIKEVETFSKVAFSFMRLRRYPENGLIEQMYSYDDWVESECDLIILYWDGGYYHVYSKNEEEVRKIYAQCIKNGYKAVEFVTTENNTRKVMYA